MFHAFLYDRVYHNPVAKGEEAKVENILRGIWEHYCRHPEKLPDDFRGIMERDGLERAVTDYVSGMTDYTRSINTAKSLFRWRGA